MTALYMLGGAQMDECGEGVIHSERPTDDIHDRWQTGDHSTVDQHPPITKWISPPTFHCPQKRQRDIPAQMVP